MVRENSMICVRRGLGPILRITNVYSTYSLLFSHAHIQISHSSTLRVKLQFPDSLSFTQLFIQVCSYIKYAHIYKRLRSLTHTSWHLYNYWPKQIPRYYHAFSHTDTQPDSLTYATIHTILLTPSPLHKCSLVDSQRCVYSNPNTHIYLALLKKKSSPLPSPV